MEKMEIGQPKKAWEEQRVTTVFKQRALEPRVVQAKIVYPPVIRLCHGRAAQAEINDARNKKDERRQSSAYPDSPLGYDGKFIHRTKSAGARNRERRSQT